ncbi:hypothetical protein GCM10007898_26540 [Dyella flagellata]|uniref:Extracellular repeat, HAF family n=1 Tax=Dyella flagellata TaxID=1867833 RepID=A0ABQ5XCP1_9GAMM|nr:hypothetical protein GCM10007898_26540 [Dyella flagellata]
MKHCGMRNFGIALGLVGTALIASSSFAGGFKPAAKFPSERMATPNAMASVRMSDSPTYTYTLLSYPGSLDTQGVGINPGALDRDWDGLGRTDKSDIKVVGAWFSPDGTSQAGFLARVAGTKPVRETYDLLNDPDGTLVQQAYSINDFGQIVGDYYSGEIGGAYIFHSYELDGDKFKPLNVPFADAVSTFSPAINDEGEIVGGWTDSAGNSHGYTRIGGSYTSFDYPGGGQIQLYLAVNSDGDIVGSYADANGAVHGFLRRGETYTSIDFPGAVYTASTGINDAGEIVGSYCPTSQCLATGGEGMQGFILKNGIYTAFAIPGEYATALASIDNKGVLMGNYYDADVNQADTANHVHTFLATPMP